MARRPVQSLIGRTVWLTTLAIAAPALTAFIALAFLDELDPVAALAGMAVVAVGTFLVARALLANLDRAAGRLKWQLTQSHGGGGKRPAEKPGEPLGWLTPWPAGALSRSLREPVRDASLERSKLRDELTALQRLIETSPAAFLLIDHHSNVLLANRAAAILLGRQVERGPLTSLLRDPGALDAVERAVGMGVDTRASFATTGGEEPNETRVLQVHVRPVSGQIQGERVAAIIILEDQTQAHRMDRMRADFIANASHELRTPLSTLAGYIETLQGPAGEDPNARERFLGIMDSQASRMARLLEDLMSLSRIEAMQDEQPTDVVDLRRVVQEQVEAMQVSAGEHGVSLKIDVTARSAAGGLDVIGDQDQLIQVTQNLLDNAIKYSRKGTAVTVSLAREPAVPGGKGGDAISMTVADHGEGIPAEYIDRVTERFFRVDTGRSRELGGTGLGLAIVKHIVNRHGGQLAVESAIGMGSRISVSLPAAEQYADVAAAT